MAADKNRVAFRLRDGKTRVDLVKELRRLTRKRSPNVSAFLNDAVEEKLAREQAVNG